jgi:EmrB/QacA subfamily drug resistance transporter
VDIDIQEKVGPSSNAGQTEFAAVWALVSAILASSMAFIGQSALNVALPAIQSSLQARGSELLWIINGYTLMLAAFILVGGSLGDRLGRKKVFMIGIALFALSSLACGFATSVGSLIVARIVQGIGGALMVPGSLAIISAAYSPERRGGAIGTWSAVTTIATVAGPVVGGFLAEAGLWRVVFFINIPIAAAALIILSRRVPESRNEEAAGGIDWTGAAAATLSLVALAYGFLAAPDFGFDAPRIFIALGLGVVFLVLFLLVENRSRNPMVRLTLFQSRSFSGANLLTLFLYGALAAYSLFLSLNVIQVQGYRESLAGFAFLPFVLILAGMSRWTGRLADRTGPRPWLILGPAIVGVGFFLTALVGLTEGPRDYWTSYFPGIAVFGIGMGFTVAPLTTTVMTSVDTRFAGTASGINNATSRVAGVLAIAVLGSVALFTFTGRVESIADAAGLGHAARAALMDEAANLGNASVPPQVPEALAAEVGRSLKIAFVHSFRIIMFVCSGLAWLSAVMAALFIEKNPAGSE